MFRQNQDSSKTVHRSRNVNLKQQSFETARKIHVISSLYLRSIGRKGKKRILRSAGTVVGGILARRMMVFYFYILFYIARERLYHVRSMHIKFCDANVLSYHLLFR
jgi:hypothetical protein